MSPGKPLLQSTRELIRLCLKKDSSAWEEFVRRFERVVFWAVERSFKRCDFPYRREDLEDLFQQVFSHLWEKGLKEAVGVERLEGWLAVVSYRVTVDYVRREGKLGRRLVPLEEGLEELLPSAENPRKGTEEELFQESLDPIFKELSEKEASVLKLNLLEEKTHAEISQLLKIPIGTVSSLIQRTKEKVAKVLKRRLEKS